MDLYREIDVRSALPAIDVPTLILHRRDDRMIPLRRRATWRSRSPVRATSSWTGADHLPTVGDFDALLDEVEEFLVGSRRGREAERALATILFTDIVGSTADGGSARRRAAGATCWSATTPPCAASSRFTTAAR